MGIGYGQHSTGATVPLAMVTSERPFGLGYPSQIVRLVVCSGELANSVGFVLDAHTLIVLKRF